MKYECKTTDNKLFNEFYDKNETENALRLRDFKFLKQINKGQFGKINLVKCHINNSIYVMKNFEKGFSKRNLNVGDLIFCSLSLIWYRELTRNIASSIRIQLLKEIVIY